MPFTRQSAVPASRLFDAPSLFEPSSPQSLHPQRHCLKPEPSSPMNSTVSGGCSIATSCPSTPQASPQSPSGSSRSCRREVREAHFRSTGGDLLPGGSSIYSYASSTAMCMDSSSPTRRPSSPPSSCSTPSVSGSTRSCRREMREAHFQSRIFDPLPRSTSCSPSRASVIPPWVSQTLIEDKRPNKSDMSRARSFFCKGEGVGPTDLIFKRGHVRMTSRDHTSCSLVRDSHQEGDAGFPVRHGTPDRLAGEIDRGRLRKSHSCQSLPWYQAACSQDSRLALSSKTEDTETRHVTKCISAKDLSQPALQSDHAEPDLRTKGISTSSLPQHTLCTSIQALIDFRKATEQLTSAVAPRSAAPSCLDDLLLNEQNVGPTPAEYDRLLSDEPVLDWAQLSCQPVSRTGEEKSSGVVDGSENSASHKEPKELIQRISESLRSIASVSTDATTPTQVNISPRRAWYRDKRETSSQVTGQFVEARSKPSSRSSSMGSEVQSPLTPRRKSNKLIAAKKAAACERRTPERASASPETASRPPWRPSSRNTKMREPPCFRRRNNSIQRMSSYQGSNYATAESRDISGKIMRLQSTPLKNCRTLEPEPEPRRQDTELRDTSGKSVPLPFTLARNHRTAIS